MNMDYTFTGHFAISYAEKWGLKVRKYADSLEDAAIIDTDRAREIAAEDPSLIYVDLTEAP